MSIVMPTYNSAEQWLRACLDSVLAQTWPHWELCIADDGSSLATTRLTLDEYARRDSRIRVVLLGQNRGIAAASNSALAQVTGKYVALLDHDDELAPWALQMIVRALAGRPDAALLYSDEDKIDEAGRRYEPYFKPDWDPVLLMAQNYISHLSVYRTETLRTLGGFRVGFDGAQDWDLVLRASEHVEARQFIHVPRVLYHWRAVEGSTARAMQSKDYAEGAQQRAVAERLRRTGTAATVSRVVKGAFLQIDPVLTGALPRVSLVVLQRCSERRSAAAARWDAYVREAGHDLAFVDALDAGMTAGHVDAAPPVLDQRAAAEVNAAVARMRGEVTVIVDGQLAPLASNWLDLLVRHAMQATVGAVGGLLFDAGMRTVHAGYMVDRDSIAASPYAGHPREWTKSTLRGGVVQTLSAVGLACLAVRQSLWERAGGLEIEALLTRYRDVDLCLRLEQAGYRNLWHPGVELAYALPLSPSADRHPAVSEADDADRRTMRRRWGARLAADPAYNPNLSGPPTLFKLNDFADLRGDFVPLSFNA
ncbi:MAG: glycosyltransferase family 2 protein [Casimicrobiaceae bacterium]